MNVFGVLGRLLNFAAIAAFFVRARADLLAWPLLEWCRPWAWVRVLPSSGKAPFYRFAPDGKDMHNKPCGRVRYLALELQADQFLGRSLYLPHMGRALLDAVVAAEVQKISPFIAEDLAWGMRATPIEGNRYRIDVALASRRSIEQELQTHKLSDPALKPEVWCHNGDAAICLRGYGENLRERSQQWQLRLALALAILALGAVLAVPLTSAIKLRWRMQEAVAAYDVLDRKAAPHAKARADFQKFNTQLENLRGALQSERPSALEILDHLTRAVPDNTIVSEFRLKGASLAISGDTENATKLIQIIGADPMFAQIRALQASSKAPGAARESYSFEIKLPGAVEEKAPHSDKGRAK